MTDHAPTSPLTDEELVDFIAALGDKPEHNEMMVTKSMLYAIALDLRASRAGADECIVNLQCELEMANAEIERLESENAQLEKWIPPGW